MSIPWRDYWGMHDEQIRDGLSKWRQRGFARVSLKHLRNQLAPSGQVRRDLYSCVTVTIHGALSGVSGKRHMETLAQVIAPLLKEGENPRVCTKGKGSAGDYLEFSQG